MNEEKRWDKNSRFKVLCIVVVVFCLVTIFNMNDSIKNLQQEIISLRQDLNQLHSSISGEISGISGNVEASLKKENSIISAYSYQIQSEKINREEMNIPLNLTVRPKEHKDGLKATFIIETEDGKAFSAQGIEGEAYTYTASMVLPMSEYLKLSIAFDDGVIQKSEMLEEIYQPMESYFMKVDSYISSMSTNSQYDFSKRKLQLNGTIETNLSTNADGSNYPVSAVIQITKNGKTVKELPIQIDQEFGSDTQSKNGAPPPAVAEVMGGSSVTYSTGFDEVVSYKENDIIEIIVLVKDNFGFQYKQNIHSEKIDSDGNTYTNSISNEVTVE